jgi:hypothetical protein
LRIPGFTLAIALRVALFSHLEANPVAALARTPDLLIT